MRHHIRAAATVIFLFIFTYVNASSTTDHFDNRGKIYTVIICAAIIIIGIALYLFYIERRLKKLEDRYRDEEAVSSKI